MPDFLTIAAFLGIAMLIWNCVEVGRNDAANIVNAVYGARVLRRRPAVLLAAIFVVMGTAASEAVMDTARKGLFDPVALGTHTDNALYIATCIYISVYFVNTVMLYGFSGFGMPVSTTACLVFSVLGAAYFLAPPEIIKWNEARTVVGAIFISIVIAGIASFLAMRVFRGAIRDKATDRETVLLHGPWIAGAMFTFLIWFMIFKGMKNIEFVKAVRGVTFDHYGAPVILLCVWAILTFIVHMALVLSKGALTRHLFSFTAVVGMVCMAFAFGQNDLANAASPGLSVWTLWRHQGEGIGVATRVPLAWWALLGCGMLIASGMFTNYAQRVTRAEVNTGSQFDEVSLYAPEWCKKLARVILRNKPQAKALAPEPSRTEDPSHKKIHYDTLRASVIMAVSGSVIAFASGYGLPVSTTYVAFAAVVGTGFSDRVFTRGDSDLKIGRSIWVVTTWLVSPVISVLATGLLALVVYSLGTTGLVLGLVLNMIARFLIQRQADKHEKLYHKERETAAVEG